MANTTGNAKIICPYYQATTEKSISCEGLVPGTTVFNRFDSVAATENFLETRCATYEYAGCCPLAAALEQKYTE